MLYLFCPLYKFCPSRNLNRKKGKSAQVTDNFMIIARIESLILNKGLDDALYRAKKYRDVFNLGNGYILAENKNNEFEIKKLLGE